MKEIDKGVLEETEIFKFGGGKAEQKRKWRERERERERERAEEKRIWRKRRERILKFAFKHKPDPPITSPKF